MLFLLKSPYTDHLLMNGLLVLNIQLPEAHCIVHMRHSNTEYLILEGFMVNCLHNVIFILFNLQVHVCIIFSIMATKAMKKEVNSRPHAGLLHAMVKIAG